MGFTTSDYVAFLARTQKRTPQPKSDGVAREMDLHEEIMAYCNSQFPRWKYIRARSDMASTIAVGAQDFSIFIPGGKVLCIECKRKGAKQSIEQLGWALEMERLGHKVHVVRSLVEFLGVLTDLTQSTPETSSPARSPGQSPEQPA